MPVSRPPANRKPGRRPGAQNTREAISAAALAQFAERGYTATSIRSIAAAAAVDPSLVTHFFRTKDDLFRAAVEDFAAGPVPAWAALSDNSPGLGVRVALAYLSMWEEPSTGPRLRAIARAVTESPVAAEILSEALGAAAIAHVRAESSVDRLQLVFSQLLGTAFARYILQVRPLADVLVEEIAEVMGPGLERHLI